MTGQTKRKIPWYQQEGFGQAVARDFLAVTIYMLFYGALHRFLSWYEIFVLVAGLALLLRVMDVVYK